MTDFAKSQLMKYGWTEGKGLGKNETGITQAIKPKLKFDKAGIDHKDTDWKEWWETGFNKAANNIVIESQTHGISILVSSKDAAEKSLKDDLIEKKSKHTFSYTNFLKTSTLVNGNMIKENNSNQPKVAKLAEDPTHIPLTDEELFKVCGGRTAHKGARHGLTLNGKLKRIAQQEKDLLSSSIRTNKSNELQNHNSKCLKYQYETDENENDNENALPVNLSSEEESNAPKESKNKRRKRRRRIDDLTHKLNILCNVSDGEKNTCEVVEEKEKSKRKKRKLRKESAVTDNVEGARKQEEDKEIDIVFPADRELEKIVEGFENVFLHKKRKKKSKRERHHINEDGYGITDEDVNFNNNPAKKSKKSHKSDTVAKKLEAEPNYIEPPIKLHEIEESNEYLELLEDYNEEVKRLNAKIVKKKEAKHRRKQQARLDKIRASLEAVHFDIKGSTEKKNFKSKLNTIVEEIMEFNIATDKTETLKNLVKKKERNKNK